MKITDFDPAEYLTTKETIVEYLNEALKTSVEDNASEHFIEALGDVTRAQGITNAAKATKLINKGLSRKFCFITDCIALTSHGAVVFFLFLIISTDKLKGYLLLCRLLFLFFAHKVLNIITKQ